MLRTMTRSIRAATAMFMAISALNFKVKWNVGEREIRGDEVDTEASWASGRQMTVPAEM